MLKIPYGKDLVVDFPLITAAGTEFAAAAPASVAAGDATIAHNRLTSTNLSGKTVTFTSGGTYEIKPGDTITGATSAATAVVMGVRLTSGTFAAGTAAGGRLPRGAALRGTWLTGGGPCSSGVKDRR